MQWPESTLANTRPRMIVAISEGTSLRAMASRSACLAQRDRGCRSARSPSASLRRHHQGHARRSIRHQAAHSVHDIDVHNQNATETGGVAMAGVDRHEE